MMLHQQSHPPEWKGGRKRNKGKQTQKDAKIKDGKLAKNKYFFFQKQRKASYTDIQPSLMLFVKGMLNIIVTLNWSALKEEGVPWGLLAKDFQAPSNDKSSVATFQWGGNSPRCRLGCIQTKFYFIINGDWLLKKIYQKNIPDLLHISPPPQKKCF